MPEMRRKFDAEFREGAVRLVRETGKPIAAIARDLGVNEGTLGNWVVKDKAAREGVEGLSRDDAAELKRLRRSEEHTSELQSPCNLVCRLLLEKKKIENQS